MRFIKHVPHRVVTAYALALGIVAVVGLVPFRLVRAEDTPATKSAPKEKTGPGYGRFVSFKDGTLTLEANDLVLIKNKVPENAKAQFWDGSAYKPMDAAAALNQAKPGAWISVRIDKEIMNMYVGAKGGKTVGTFVSFKENRLMLLGKDLGNSYVKKYGNQLHMPKFRDDVPAFESIDGEEYKPVGTANKVLGDVKEGTVVTVHGEGDGNLTLVQIGVPKQK